jgi:ubiquitin conjugation factor E4 B
VPDEKESSKPNVNLSKQPNNVTASNSFSQVGIRSVTGGSRINISPAAGRPVTPAKRDHASSATGSEGPRPAESLEDWENRVLSGVFGITLNPKITQDGHGNALHYLAGVQSDLEEQGEVVRVSTGVLEQAIVEVASNLQKRTPLDYLLGCWKRVSRLFRSFKGAGAEDLKYRIIKEARRLCMSYCIFAVTMPDMFG